jgi:3-isopropylmalate/(R)-2-methylmalate dehydratase large subunit
LSREAEPVRLHGPVLVLTEDPGLIAAQLDRTVTASDALVRQPLLDNVSTDEIIPGWCCYWYDQRLGDYAYLGLRHATPAEGAVRALDPQVIVSGHAKGCGSSREHAVYAEKYAGARIVFARSFERIYQQNCRNVGILACDDFDLLSALLAGEEVGLEEFTRRSTGVERAIIALGGLFGYHRARADATAPPVQTRFAGPRPLNYVEKIIQSRLAAGNRCPDGATVRVGESYFVEADVRFSHEYVTPMAAEMFTAQFGPDASVADPGSCYFFQDHLSLAAPVLARRRNGTELIARVDDLSMRQRDFAARAGGHFVGPGRAICHTYLVENLARPGEVVVGTDSHTCTSGAVGAFAFGVGATDIAAAWYTRQVLVKVPEVVKVTLIGQVRQGVCAKDAVLTLLGHPGIAGSRTIGRVLLFTGPGCAALNIDERTTLCNMAVEAGATTAVIEPDAMTHEFLVRRPDPSHRNGSRPPVPDEGAAYAGVVEVDLAAVEPMVSLPGDPRNAVPLSSVGRMVTIDRAYGGSCTGGKAHDMDMYANVFAVARAHGLRVPAGVTAYVQMGSESVLAYATGRGYVQLFEDVGVRVLPPSCGACINAGPGVSERADEVTVSAQNRNFPGRSGPGQVYLASPYVVAASAIAGRLCSVEDITS